MHVSCKNQAVSNEIQLHDVHNRTGKRMIAQWKDGVSRVAFRQGMLRGEPILDYVPLSLSALERALELGM